MGTPIEHNSGKPTYESPCVTRKATKEELEEIVYHENRSAEDRKIMYKELYELNNNNKEDDEE